MNNDEFEIMEEAYEEERLKQANDNARHEVMMVEYFEYIEKSKNK